MKLLFPFFRLTVLAWAVLSTAQSGPRRLVQDSAILAASLAAQNKNGAVHAMMTSPEALQAAFSAIQSSPQLDKPGDIIVDLVGSQYRARFFFVISTERKLDHLVEVSLDSQSGKVTKVEDKGNVAGLPDRSAEKGWETFLSGKRAFALAVHALNNFDNYDKKGKLSVELRKSTYYVTFPLLRRPDTGPLAADYAVQISIDARSGKVLKVLIAS